MLTKVAKFTFVVPDTHPQAGEKIEKSFDYQECQTEGEALAVIADKASKSEKAAQSWSILALVNDAVKANARSNAYQAATLPFRPTDSTPEEQFEVGVRNMIRMGIPEAIARVQLTALLEAQKSDAPTE